MCRYVTTNLSSTECDLYQTGVAAHQYTKWTYWLCRNSQDGRPCSNKRPREDQIGSDFGSRHGPCPVCENLRAAEEKYKLACQRATEVYNALIKEAYEANAAEGEDAKFVVESIPYSHRNSKGHYYRYHGH